jgi:hypothetical protein
VVVLLLVHAGTLDTRRNRSAMRRRAGANDR